MDARPDQGFPSSCRLRSSREYIQVGRRGRRCQTPHLTVIGAVGAVSGFRLGISVSRKVGNAVQRNRIKRWIREYCRVQLAGMETSLVLSVIAKPGAAFISHAIMDSELREAIGRLLGDGDA